MLDRLKARARAFKGEVFAVYLAAKDPRTPWYAKILVFLVAAHTFSPIDLVPDFIPIIGYLDDLIIIPLGLALAVRLIPAEVLAETRRKATDSGVDGLRRVSSRRSVKVAGVAVILVFLLRLIQFLS